MGDRSAPASVDHARSVDVNVAWNYRRYSHGPALLMLEEEAQRARCEQRPGSGHQWEGDRKAGAHQQLLPFDPAAQLLSEAFDQF